MKIFVGKASIRHPVKLYCTFMFFHAPSAPLEMQATTDDLHLDLAEGWHHLKQLFNETAKTATCEESARDFPRSLVDSMVNGGCGVTNISAGNPVVSFQLKEFLVRTFFFVITLGSVNDFGTTKYFLPPYTPAAANGDVLDKWPEETYREDDGRLPVLSGTYKRSESHTKSTLRSLRPRQQTSTQNDSFFSWLKEEVITLVNEIAESSRAAQAAAHRTEDDESTEDVEASEAGGSSLPGNTPLSDAPLSDATQRITKGRPGGLTPPWSQVDTSAEDVRTGSKSDKVGGSTAPRSRHLERPIIQRLSAGRSGTQGILTYVHAEYL